jgi:beta-N-acetylhexosaminidase
MVGLLREKMGFKGIIITDDLEMRAIALKMDPVQAAVEAIKAGADMAIVSRNSLPRIPIRTILNELEKAASRGDLPPKRLRESLERVTSFRRRWKGGAKEIVEDASFPGARRLARGLLEGPSQWVE